jgi:hypothetical protein
MYMKAFYETSFDEGTQTKEAGDHKGKLKNTQKNESQQMIRQ